VTVPAPPKQPETMLQKETRIFTAQLKRLSDCILNNIFDLTVKGSQRRNLAIIFLFFALGFIFSLRAHTLGAWMAEFQFLLRYIFNPFFAQTYPDIPNRFFTFAFGAIRAPQTLRLLPVFVLPFLIALQSAAIYLADIFELEDAGIARAFIRHVALTGSRKSIRIGKGDIVDEDKNSPIALIGGPGEVVVELDSAALFEKPNGKPRVIGPTVKGKIKLEGFERFRQAIDLRDQYTDPLDVKSRSLDGIPVSTADVRMVFSVWREGKQPGTESPHPFSEKAIESLVYGQASRVVLDGPNPSEPPSSWAGTIQSLIRGQLGGFMSKHRLVEYLASIGLPEVERARERENEVVEAGQAVVGDDDELEPRYIPPPPDFQARHIVSNLFSQFAEDFTKNASKRGVELGWIGVGTWKMPTNITEEIITGKHLEAWQLSRENLARSSDIAIDGLQQEAQLQQILRLIQSTPLARFQQNAGREHKDTVQDLLIAYREQLIEIIELLTKSNSSLSDSVQIAIKYIRAAIKYIEDILGIKHWVGGAGPTSGTGAPDEEALYQDLLQKTGGDTERVERLIEYERTFAPNASRAELLQRAIDRYLKDNR